MSVPMKSVARRLPRRNRSVPVSDPLSWIMASAGLLTEPGGVWRERKPPSCRGPNIWASVRSDAANRATASIIAMRERGTEYVSGEPLRGEVRGGI